MNLQKISGITLLFLLISHTAIAVPVTSSFQISESIDGKAQIAVDKWVSDTSDKLAVLEDALYDNDPKAVYKIVNFKDVMKSTFTGYFISYPEYQVFKNKLLDLRTEYNKRGVYTGDWKDWNFDGQTLTDNEINLIKEIETQLNEIHRLNYDDPKVILDLNKITEMLTGPQFSYSPVLKYYKENLGLDLLQGAKYRNGLSKITKIAKEYRGLSSRIKIKKNMAPHDIEFAEKLAKELTEVKNLGVALKDFKFKLNEKDPLSQEFTLEQVRNQLINL